MVTASRQTASLCRLAELHSGEWIQPAGLSPSGIQTARGMLTRINALGVVVEKQDGSFFIDDGSAVVRVRSFDPNFSSEDIEVGVLMMIIGRPREYNGERYVALEISRTIGKDWAEYRRKELEGLGIGMTTPAKRKEESSPLAELLERIRSMDEGKGAPADRVIAGVENGDAQLRRLLEEGEVFEIRPGLLKILE